MNLGLIENHQTFKPSLALSVLEYPKTTTIPMFGLPKTRTCLSIYLRNINSLIICIFYLNLCLELLFIRVFSLSLDLSYQKGELLRNRSSSSTKRGKLHWTICTKNTMICSPCLLERFV